MSTYIDTNTGELMELILRTENNYDRDEASYVSGLKCQDESRTQQQFAEEADINTIVRRFGISGIMPADFGMPQSADFSETITDYHTALNLIRRADEDFMQLPGQLRERFQNDPQRLIDFIENPANLEEARELKLAKPAEKVEPPLQEGGTT